MIPIMKKILFFSMVLFAFSFSTNAQTAVNTYEPEALAKKDLHDLVNVLDLSETPDVFVALNQLFISTLCIYSKVLIIPPKGYTIHIVYLDLLYIMV